MKILILSDFNIAGQPTLLAQAINKYTKHEARCIIAHPDYMSYDKDIILEEDGLEAATALVHDWKPDFFHFGRYIFNWPGVDFNKLVNPANCVIKYYGSDIRDNGPAMRKMHAETGLPAITGNDFTATSNLPASFYHLNSYFTKFGFMDRHKVPLAPQYEGMHCMPLKICCGSGGHPHKGYGFLGEVVAQLKAEGYPVELDVITGISNAECLARKQQAHAVFTSLNGGWGISGVEGMFMGQAVLSCLDPFVLSMYPEQPAVLVDRAKLKDKLIKLIRDPTTTNTLAALGRQFAFDHFRADRLVIKYLYIIDLIRNHEKYSAGQCLPEEVYKLGRYWA